MSELVTFLSAQLDADEAVARACLSREPGAREGVRAGHWVAEDPDRGTPRAGRFGHVATVGITVVAWPDHAAHIAAHDPARVLVEVEAKRAIVALHLGCEGYDGRWWCNACADGAYGDKAEWPCPTLRLLAVPFADRPGFDETWRP